MGEYIGLGQAAGASAWLIPKADGSVTWGTSLEHSGKAIELWTSTDGGNWTLQAQSGAGESHSERVPWMAPGHVFMWELRAYVPGQPATLGVLVSVTLDWRTSPPTTTGVSTSAPPSTGTNLPGQAPPGPAPEELPWLDQEAIPGVKNLYALIGAGGIVAAVALSQKR